MFALFSKRFLWPIGYIIAATIAVLACSLPSQAADSDKLRPYIGIRGGGAYFTNPDGASGVELDNFEQFPFPSLTAGVNINRYFGAEIAVDYNDADLQADDGSGKVGEYSTWQLLGQLRLRYPLWNDKLVPYLLLGGGVGLGEFNDRNVNSTFNFSGGQDAALIGAAGIGLEYFIADNIAFGVEAKQIFGFQTDVTVNGQSREMDLDNTYISVGMRLFLDGLVPGDDTTGSAAPPPGDNDDLRGYIVLRTGGASFISPGHASQVDINSPALMDFGAGVGVNFDENWGFEITGEFWEPTLEASVGTVAEYTLYNVMGQVRYRYPLFGTNRLVPYVLAGAGVGVSEVNDRRTSFSNFPIKAGRDVTPVGSVGAGMDYFLADNISLVLEAKHIFAFDSDVKIGGEKVTLRNASLLYSAGLRIYFP